MQLACHPEQKLNISRRSHLTVQSDVQTVVSVYLRDTFAQHLVLH